MEYCNSTTATVFWGNGIPTIALHYLQTVLALTNDGLLCLVSDILRWEKNISAYVLQYWKNTVFKAMFYFFAYTPYEL